MCTELGIEPQLLGDLPKLREMLEPMLNDFDPAQMNVKQLIDKLIEQRIETRCC